jgi:predicted  nucleic acid-binding Zn-ribbon protein
VQEAIKYGIISINIMQITNTRITKLLTDKDTLVHEGRKISKEIEKMEKRIETLSDKEREITGKVEPVELGKEAEKLQAEIRARLAEFDKVSKAIMEEKMSAIPKDIEEEHKKLLADIETAERERNKIALKVQKIKDRVVPLIKKEVAPLLKEYEDIESIEVKGEVANVKVFSYLEEFKTRFNKNKQK